jgi:hypothetical protein
VFPGEVASYRDIKRDSSVLQSASRRIFILAPWQASLVDGITMDLAFNGSFEEMSPESVRGYLACFNRWHAKMIHIRSLDVPKRPGALVTDDYAACLPDYRLQARESLLDGTTPRPFSVKGVGESRPASAVYFRRND